MPSEPYPSPALRAWANQPLYKVLIREIPRFLILTALFIGTSKMILPDISMYLLAFLLPIPYTLFRSCIIGPREDLTTWAEINFGDWHYNRTIAEFESHLAQSPTPPDLIVIITTTIVENDLNNRGNELADDNRITELPAPPM